MKGDLPLFAMLQVPILLLSILPARALAASYAYPSAPLGYLASLVFRSLPWDLLFLAILGLLVLPTRRLVAPARARTPLLIVLYLAFAFLGVLYFLAAGLFMRVGGTPSWELLRMAPPLLLHAPKVVSSTDPVLVLAGMVFLWPAALTPAIWSAGLGLVRSSREWSLAGWALPLGLVLAGGLAAALPQDSYRERILRRISPVNLLRPPAPPAARPVELTPRDREVIAGLLGPPRDDGRAALAPLRDQELNVVVWVMESIGERFLASHHRFGEASTPHLDRLAARGSVRFSRVHVECPLSIQSNYTLVTGASPPANPSLFKSGLPIEPPTPYLGPAVRAGGRHSAFFNSSDLTIWGEPRFMEKAVDVFEDANNLANRAGYETTDWSFEGRALIERLFSWTDGLPPGEPFVAFVWNVEPHYPHQWVGMPEEIEKADVATRFRAVIEHNDRLLGELYDGLVGRGLDEDTLLVAVGDHGQGLGRGGRPYDRFESLLVSEDATQIPLVFVHGRLPEGARVVDTPATLADLYPTLLDLIGVGVPEGADGASLAREYQPRVSVSRAITWWPLAARAGRFKLVIDSPDDPPELYDLEADPWETRDVSGRHEEVTRALWAYLEATTARLREEDPSFALF